MSGRYYFYIILEETLILEEELEIQVSQREKELEEKQTRSAAKIGVKKKESLIIEAKISLGEDEKVDGRG